MLFCIQANPCLPNNTQLQLPRLESSWRTLTPLKVLRPAAKTSTYLSFALVPKLRHHNLTAKYPRKSLVCLLGGKDKPEGENEGSPLKSLGNAFGSFQGKSVEDVLKEQMQKQEFYDGGGGGGGSPPRGGGGGGGASGGSQDDDLPGVLDETLQVVLATVGFILLYIYIINGEDMTRILKDYLKYVFTGNKSVRLAKVLEQWESYRQKLAEKKQVDKFWLEREIINTTTWYDNPDKYRRIYRAYVQAANDNDNDNDNGDNDDDDIIDY
ncbi:unnamed protein product [Linum tenue]|uniref:Uncharacterized protein n=1 Tax=Linum tenue TaxID=586396 RepID=A0AAV0IGZ9_9ROSI|nr:unnamed protein product [Linum tenue]